MSTVHCSSSALLDSAFLTITVIVTLTVRINDISDIYASDADGYWGLLSQMRAL